MLARAAPSQPSQPIAKQSLILWTTIPREISHQAGTVIVSFLSHVWPCLGINPIHELSCNRPTVFRRLLQCPVNILPKVSKTTPWNDIGAISLRGEFWRYCRVEQGVAAMMGWIKKEQILRGVGTIL